MRVPGGLWWIYVSSRFMRWRKNSYLLRLNTIKQSFELSHGCVCSRLWVNGAPILWIVFSYAYASFKIETTRVMWYACCFHDSAHFYLWSAKTRLWIFYGAASQVVVNCDCGTKTKFSRPLYLSLVWFLRKKECFMSGLNSLFQFLLKFTRLSALKGYQTQSKWGKLLKIWQ